MTLEDKVTIDFEHYFLTSPIIKQMMLYHSQGQLDAGQIKFMLQDAFGNGMIKGLQFKINGKIET